jgi:hypothetical protein
MHCCECLQDIWNGGNGIFSLSDMKSHAVPNQAITASFSDTDIYFLAENCWTERNKFLVDSFFDCDVYTFLVLETFVFPKSY